MKITISAESTCDLPVEILEKYKIPTIHFNLEMNGETFRDDKYDIAELFDFTEKTGKMCHTSAPNQGEYIEYFSNLLKTSDKIIHFSISSKLSCSYNNACVAAAGNPNILVVDTHGTSGSIGCLILYAQKLLEEGYSAEDIYSKITKIKNNTTTSFIINNLKYLHKGGRCSGLGYFATKLLSLRPVINTSEDGSFKIGKTYRGDSEKCIYRYVKDLLETRENIDKTNAFINISTCDDKIVEGVKTILKEYGFENIYFTHASPVNSYHAGPGVLGVQFLYNCKAE